jgi:hypothetical protein
MNEGCPRRRFQNLRKDTVKKNKLYYTTREDEMTVESVSIHRDVPLKEGKALVRLEGRFEEEENKKIWE